jgi:preprotein translocase subunit SecD
MPKGAGWRITLIIGFIALSCIYLVPTLMPQLPSWWKGLLPKDKISLGLDLQGGTHLVMEVETQKAVEGTLDLVATDLEDTLGAKNLRYKRISRTGPDKVSIVLYEKETAGAVQKLLKDKYRDYEQVSSVEEGGMVGLQLRMKEQDIRDRKDKAVAQALETIRNRIDQFGVSEPIIARQGINQIVVQLPGIKDPQRAIDLIGRTARLEFKMVREGVSPTGGMIPEDAEVLY